MCIRDREYMYGDGEICVRAYKRDEKLFMEVEDNGPGMTREQTENLLNGTLKSLSLIHI